MLRSDLMRVRGLSTYAIQGPANQGNRQSSTIFQTSPKVEADNLVKDEVVWHLIASWTLLVRV